MSQSAVQHAARIGLFLALLATSASAQDPWPMYQANPGHTGQVDVVIDPDTIEERWTRDLGAQGLNPLCVGEDAVVATDSVRFQNGKVHALDPSTGEVLWDFGLGAPNSINPPTIANGRAYVQTGNHAGDTWLHGFDVATGQRIFRSSFAAQWERYLAPTVVDGVVYVNGGYYGGMYAFDGGSGAELWFRSLPQYDEWTPAVDDQHAYSYVGGQFFAVERSSGEIAYQVIDQNYDWQGYSMRLAPVLGSQQNSFVIYNGRLMSFDLEARELGWERDEKFAGVPALADGVLYAVNDGSLTAMEESTGEIQWTWVPPQGVLDGRVVLTAGHALVQTGSHLYLVRLDTRQLEWSRQDAGHVAIGASALYLARADGSVTSLGFQALPNPARAEPGRGLYYDLPGEVLLSGSSFERDGETRVFVGEIEAQAEVLDDETIRILLPELGPGRYDIRVENAVGTGTLTGGFLSYPALELEGASRPGELLQLTFSCDAGDGLFGIWGLTPIEEATPPFHGTLGILPFRLLFTVGYWPVDDFVWQARLPDDPDLVGIEFHVQALVGPDFSGAGKVAGWTNRRSTVIE